MDNAVDQADPGLAPVPPRRHSQGYAEVAGPC
jgi:hypothetical protein